MTDARVERVSKSGGAAVAVSDATRDSSISSVDGLVYFANNPYVYVTDARTGAAAPLKIALVPTAGATYVTSILGAAPGRVVVMEAAGWTHTVFRGFIASDLCAHAATSLGSALSDVYHSYQFLPLFEPPVAVDGSGVYVGDRRATTFDFAPRNCRPRATRR